MADRGHSGMVLTRDREGQQRLRVHHGHGGFRRHGEGHRHGGALPPVPGLPRRRGGFPPVVVGIWTINQAGVRRRGRCSSGGR